MTSEPVISILELTRRFGERIALASVNISVARGSVYGLVGANGAGKTTLIRHILGLLRAQEGSVRVFGRDPVAEPVSVLSRTGYLSEENDIPGWMRVEELIRYSKAFYPAWDDAYAEELRGMFELDRAAMLKNLSKGQRARAGLLVALAYRPELLVLDEPSSGLDPIVRRDILNAIIRTIADEGRTVLFSSHLLDEVEQVADAIAMLDHGKVLLSETMESLKASHRSVTIRFGGPIAGPPKTTAALRWERKGSEWTALIQGDTQRLTAFLSAADRVVDDRPATLDEIFLARADEAKSAQPEN